MRVECEACRQLVVASFGIDGGAVRATCPACRHVMRVPETSPGALVDALVDAPVDAPVAAPSGATRCPKCGAPLRREAIACPACGLTVARMAAYIQARDGGVPGPVCAAWTRATQAWTAAAPHDELLRLVATHHAYAWAAGRYRSRGRDAIALRQLDRLRRAAEATLLASATVRPDEATRPYRATRRVLVLLILLIAMGTVYATVLRVHPAGSGGRAIPARPPTLERPLPPATVK